MIDALGAQRSLEVVSEPVPAPVASAATASEPAAKSDGDAVFGKKEMAFSMVLGLVHGRGAVHRGAGGHHEPASWASTTTHTLAWNIVDGLLRVAVFVFYIWLIGRMERHQAHVRAITAPSIRPSIATSMGCRITPENARQFPRLHVRCGTAFLIMVMIIAILVYTVIAAQRASSPACGRARRRRRSSRSSLRRASR